MVEMVASVNAQHVFKFPVESVFQSFVDLNKKQGHPVYVNSTKDGAMSCVRWRTTTKNFFPSFFLRAEPLQTSSILYEDEHWAEEKARRYWIRRRNITWEDQAVIFHSAHFSPAEGNSSWCKWEQDTAIDFGSFGKIGLVMEYFSKRYFKTKIQEDIRIVEKSLANDIDINK